MFKYVWIIMLIVMALLFIAYTVWCAFDVFTDYVIESVSDFLEQFLDEHTFVSEIWLAFLVVGLSALFIGSLVAWNGYLE